MKEKIERLIFDLDELINALDDGLNNLYLEIKKAVDNADYARLNEYVVGAQVTDARIETLSSVVDKLHAIVGESHDEGISEEVPILTDEERNL